MDEDAKEIYPAKWLRITITILALLVVIAHSIYPKVKPDAMTWVAIVVAVFPWLTPLLESVELPGGLKFTLREVQKKVSQIDEQTSDDRHRLACTVELLKLSQLNDQLESKLQEYLENQKAVTDLIPKLSHFPQVAETYKKDAAIHEDAREVFNEALEETKRSKVKTREMLVALSELKAAVPADLTEGIRKQIGIVVKQMQNVDNVNAGAVAVAASLRKLL